MQRVINNGRSGGIRTRDPLLPKQMRYQAALRSDKLALYARNWTGRQTADFFRRRNGCLHCHACFAHSRHNEANRALRYSGHLQSLIHIKLYNESIHKHILTPFGRNWFQFDLLQQFVA